MTDIIIFLTCLAAVFFGWAIGPVFLPLLKKFLEWDKKNAEESKKYAKKYSISGVWFTHPDLWDARGEIFKALIALALIIWVWIKWF